MPSALDVVIAEREAARGELQKTRIQLDVIQRRAQAAIEQQANELTALRNFLGAILYDAGGELAISNAAFEEVTRTMYVFEHDADAEQMTVTFRLVKAPESSSPTIIMPAVSAPA